MLTALGASRRLSAFAAFESEIDAAFCRCACGLRSAGRSRQNSHRPAYVLSDLVESLTLTLITENVSSASLPSKPVTHS
jgi:hypothetical protein